MAKKIHFPEDLRTPERDVGCTDFPERPGWYLCEYYWWRWWDGKFWSYGALRGCSRRTVGEAAKKRATKAYQSKFRWYEAAPSGERP